MPARQLHRWRSVWATAVLSLMLNGSAFAAPSDIRTHQFNAANPTAAREWQRESRAVLFRLMMGGHRPETAPLAVEMLRSEQLSGSPYRLEQLSFQSTPGRRAQAWLAVPANSAEPVGALLALHGHGGSGEDVIFDFADIFACVAPRTLILELGDQERAPGGFPVNIGSVAFSEIRQAYHLLDASRQAEFEVHSGGHVFSGRQLDPRLAAALGLPTGNRPTPPHTIERACLQAITRELLFGSQVTADDGTVLYTPDGKGNYRALWTRDFAYMVENACDLIPLEHVESGIRYLIRGIRPDGTAPDRVRPDGVAVHIAGPENAPLGRPNLDNAQFLAILIDECLRRVPTNRARSLFDEWSAPLDRALDYIPRAATGLVWNDPTDPHSPYGFTDTVGKTGELCFESLLYWTACQRMESWHRLYGCRERARELANRAARIVEALPRLWDHEHGAFLAASQDCRQLDVWANAYAIYLDFPLADRRPRILEFLTSHYDRCVWRGQVRHLLRGEYWQRLLVPIEPDRYQNGAYWATASGWMMYALAQTQPELARQMWHELLTDFQANGVCECVHGEYRQLPSYVVSAANPLAAARRLGW